MGDLFLDDIEDENVYPDAAILHDIRALMAAGQREGPMLDYKREISDKDNWPEAAASFANTFGGLLIFGAEAKGDQPFELVGFDPKGVETKTKLVSILLSRVQPRPEFQIRVVSHDLDPGKEIAMLRVGEGSHPPYMYSRNEAHRVFIRIGAQKVEADYLQLAALFEKQRKTASSKNETLSDLAGPDSALFVMQAFDSNVESRDVYRFIIAPDSDRATQRLTASVERQFKRCVERIDYTDLPEKLMFRKPRVTYFCRSTKDGREQRLAVTSKGAVGFATQATIDTEGVGKYFEPYHFSRDLVNFLVSAAAFYEHTGYYGSNLFEFMLRVPEPIEIFRESRNTFDPPLEVLQTYQAVFYTTVILHPVTMDRIYGYLEEMTHDLARLAGRVLHDNFRARTKDIIEEAVGRFRIL